MQLNNNNIAPIKAQEARGVIAEEKPIEETASLQPTAAESAEAKTDVLPETEPAEVKTDEEPEAEPIVGVVTDCLKLNLREEPEVNANILTVLPALTEVAVDLDESTDTFYKVCTAAGVQGFCMKKYISIRR